MMFDEMLFSKIIVPFELSENSEVETLTDVFSCFLRGLSMPMFLRGSLMIYAKVIFLQLGFSEI